MVGMPAAEQIALVAAWVAMTSELTEVRTTEGIEIRASDSVLTLKRDEDDDAMYQMSEIARVLFFYDQGDEPEFDTLEDLQEATLRCWAEGVLDE